MKCKPDTEATRFFPHTLSLSLSRITLSSLFSHIITSSFSNFSFKSSIFFHKSNTHKKHYISELSYLMTQVLFGRILGVRVVLEEDEKYPFYGSGSPRLLEI
ncbi:hypothetical protein MtrunA17_Chr1g0169491 [Medicago truncatula]|uniref:Uncharacterized protein n=1 Tax=Medicago truncatula TaxID=3880 RepID=A0A396JR50_MEDTR|nr:hypothetical protein MtrunA17_Chr1g0169491 [Medicago truncatula]